MMSKFWLLTVHTQLRIRLTGASADELRAITQLAEISDTPLEWWANLGDKGQLIAAPKLILPIDVEEVVEDASLERYKVGMRLTIRREKNNRLTIQLPIEGFRLGAVDDVGATMVLYARPHALELWKLDLWKVETVGTASILSAQVARTGQT